MLIDIVIFIFVLGVLVFVHELGHFLAAKACGIYVDRFSLGMPPRAFGMRIGETDYCIGALPLGGYVKMAGQEDAPLSDEERESTYGHVPEDRWFNKKPVWQRLIVIVAGPIMNFVLAIVLYGAVAAVGDEVPKSEIDNRIGYIMEDSAASRAPLYPMTQEDGAVSGEPVAHGWQTGDRIVSIDGEPIKNITDVAIGAILGGGKPMRVVLERAEAEGIQRYVSIATPEKDEKDEEQSHPRFGVMPFEAALIENVLPESRAAEAGLQKGDIIVRANGKVVDKVVFRDLVEKWPESEALPIEVQRNGQTLSMTLTPQTVGRLSGVVAGLPKGKADDETFEQAAAQEKPVVLGVDKTKVSSLKAGDVIERINGEPATVALLEQIEQGNPGGSVQFDIRRKPVLFGLVQKGEEFSAEVPISAVRAIGVHFGVLMEFHKSPPAEVLPEAFRQANQAFERTLKTLVVLISGNVSPKELGGPVMIYNVTTAAANEGWWWLFKITAFVSVNLFVFNLLPLPVLDGGLLVLLVIEGIRKKPVSLKVQERIQQVGMIFLIGLLLYVTYNDILRALKF